MLAFTRPLIILLSCSSLAFAMRQTRQAADPQSSPATEVSYVDQGWTPEIRQAFHFATQGSELIPYYWFLNLKEPDGVTLFKDDLQQFRVLYDNVTPDPSNLNPDHLPIGFVRKEETRSYGKGIYERHWLGLTCAACHTGAIIPPQEAALPDPKMVIIDGAPADADMGSFLLKLGAAVQATNSDPALLQAFARNVLQAGDGSSMTDIKTRFKAYAAQLNTLIRLYVPQSPAGPGRLDCFGAIFNRACVYDIGSSQSPPASLNAPVDFPFIWYTDRQNKIQWVGEIPNKSWIDRLGRNAGEVTGVFAQYGETTSLFPDFESSIDVPGLAKIDTWVSSLTPPKWTDLFPIDWKAVGRGRTVYQQNCQTGGCHGNVASVNQVATVEPTPLHQGASNPYQLPDLDTDARNTMLVHATVADTGTLRGIPKHLAGKPPVAARAVVGVLVASALINDWKAVALAYAEFKSNQIYHVDYEFSTQQQKEAIDQIVKKAITPRSLESQATLDHSNGTNAGPPTYGYESRSLNGIWATAPYLHNGSIPSLFELLWPNKRDPTFYVGSRVYDTKNVGFMSDKSHGGVLFNTHLAGNSNSGHTYGAKLHDPQKWDLIEFLKSL